MRDFRSRAPSFAAAVLATAAWLSLGAPASAQPVRPPQRERTGVSTTNADISRYEALYGTPEDIPLEEVIRMLQRGERFAHAVRTRGRFEDPGSGATPRSRPTYALCEGPRCLSPIRPAEEIAHVFEVESASFRARELEIVGAFESGDFLFWSYTLPDPSEAPRGGPEAASPWRRSSRRRRRSGTGMSPCAASSAAGTSSATCPRGAGPRPPTG